MYNLLKQTTYIIILSILLGFTRYFFLDDYKLMNPYILKLARSKISKGGEHVLKAFEEGFKDARIGQYLDEKLKSKPTTITEEEMIKK